MFCKNKNCGLKPHNNKYCQRCNEVATLYKKYDNIKTHSQYSQYRNICIKRKLMNLLSCDVCGLNDNSAYNLYYKKNKNHRLCDECIEKTTFCNSCGDRKFENINYKYCEKCKDKKNKIKKTK